MPVRNNKDALLKLLGKKSRPMSINSILSELGNEYSERTVRRWLQNLVKDGLISKSGQKKGTLYQIIYNEQKSDLSSFSKSSAKVIEKVRLPLFERIPVSYSDDWFDAYVPNKTSYFSSTIKEQLRKKGIRDGAKLPPGTYAHQVFRRLLIDLSYNSSRLEGNTYSISETKELILKGKEPKGKLDEEKIMILNHKEAIRYLTDQARKLDIDEETICTLHYLLSSDLIERELTGKIRNHEVKIGGSTYIPIGNNTRLKKQFLRVLEKAKHIEHPIEQSFFLLVHLSYLQPFADVNKRTARLSANLPLVKNNLVPLSFIDVKTDDFISAIIAIYELQDVRPLIDIYAASYLRSCALYDSTIDTFGIDEIRARYRFERRALIRDVILAKLKGKKIKPYVTSHIPKSVDKKLEKEFIEDVLDDLTHMDDKLSIGLGITHEELQTWLTLNRMQK